MHAYRTQAKSHAIAAIAALALTLSFAGCKSATPAAPAVDDATISSALQSRIAGDGALSNEAIQTSVKDGIATLNGTVSSEAARSLAASDASQVAGIKTVVNNLSVQQPAPAASVAPAPEPAPAPARKPPPSPKAKPRAAVRQHAPRPR